ncbi:uncharacterized protein [Dysidea avara]|uniref:uncharacterized protein n=2 Tax=Dysidea avara TaxID=196820 RepID=UPI00332B6645
MLELNLNKIVDIQLVQSNEVKGSYHMEKEGLYCCMDFLQGHNLAIDVLVTDRHKQINKWIREVHPYIKHYFDTWHVAKGFRKKFEKLGKQKDCELVSEWQKSIINHLYWCASTTPDDDSELVQAKWLSLDNHVHDVHRRHSTKFPKCSHGRLRRQERKKKWFKRHTKASEKLTSLLTKPTHLKDMTRLSGAHQTSSLESFHNVVINFAPKAVAFSYKGMKSRLKLAALHFNENSDRPQAVTKQDVERYDVIQPKYKSGGYLVRKVHVKATYGYVEQLLQETIEQCNTGGSDLQEEDPKPLCSAFERPGKATAIQQHKSRFSTT